MKSSIIIRLALGLALFISTGSALAQDEMPGDIGNPFVDQLSQPAPQTGENPSPGIGEQTDLEIPEYTPGASLAGSDYILGPGDQCIVYINSLRARSFRLGVTPEGKVFVPIIGELSVNGLTVGKLQELLTIEYSKYLKDFQVSVALTRLRTITIQVLGEVNRPGIHYMNALGRISSAIGRAGGPNSQASIRTIELMRKGEKIAVLDLYRYYRLNDQAQNPLLQFGDVVFVPISNNFVTIKGQVTSQGRYEVKEDERLRDLIAMAGGLTARASYDKLSITNIANTENVINVDVKRLMLDRDDQLNVRLKPGDIVTVSTVPVTVTVVGQVQKPGTFGFEPGTLVSYYMGMAGGYAERANTRNIKINRWGGKTIKAKENTIVEAGDVIVIGGLEIKGWRDYIYVASQAATLFFIVWQVAK